MSDTDNNELDGKTPAENLDPYPPYKRFRKGPPKYTKEAIRQGDICLVTMPVRVKMIWSDHIVDETNDSGDITATRSGWVMQVIEPRHIEYSGQNLQFLHSTTPNPK